MVHSKSIINCYGFNLKCPPKAHSLKARLPDCGNIGSWWNVLDVELSRRNLG
jgi:hypothetical protein